MTSRDLTAEQIDRMLASAERQRGYYVKAWARIQANGIPLDDPLTVAVCDAAEALKLFQVRLQQIRDQFPKPYRPLASPVKTQGLREVDQPWAHLQRQAAADVARHAGRPVPPTP